MYDRLRVASEAFDRKIGWHRVGFLVSLAVIVAAAVVLWRMLHGIDIHEVIEALRAISWRGFSARRGPCSNTVASRALSARATWAVR